MTFDNHSLFAYSSVVTVVSQNSTTLVVTVTSGSGARFAINQQVVIAAPSTQTLLSNAMVGRITGITSDTLTIDISAGNREGSNVRSVTVSDVISNSITPKIFTDIETAVNTINAALPVGAIVGTTDTQTLSSKRITKRINTIVSSTTLTPNGDTTDEYTVTSLAGGATFGVPTGTPTDGQTLIVRVKDNGTAQTLAFNAIYRFSSDLVAPTTTILGKTLYLGFIYNATDSKWDCIALLNNF